MENVPRENNNNTIDRVAVVDDKEIDLKMENETSLLDATRRRSLKEIGQEKKGMGGKCPDRKMDGGIRGWLIVLSSFLCNGLIFGVINSFSLVYGELQRILESHGVADPSSKAALVGSLTLGTTFILSPVAGVVTDKIGMRWTIVMGGIFTSSGMFLSSFVLHNINLLYLTYSGLFGIGAAFTYAPSLAVLGHYFDRYLGKVSGFATTGSSVFTAVMPFVYNHLLQLYGLPITLRVIAVLSSLILVCAMLYESPPAKGIPKTAQTPPPPMNSKSDKPVDTPLKKILKSAINVDNWKKKRYVIWVLAITISQFGYFIPYVHMNTYVKKNFPASNANLPVACIGIASGIGRLIFGFIADMPRVNRIVMHQVSVAFVGIATMILAGLDSYGMVIVCVLALGLADGCYVTLMGPIAIEICGAKGGSQAIGFLLGLCSIPLTVGPVVAGYMFDQSDSYTTVFLVSGLTPMIATLFMFLIRCVNDEPGSTIGDAEAAPSAKVAWDKDESQLELCSLTKEQAAAAVPLQGEGEDLQTVD